MPIYEYERPDGTTFEVLQSFEDEPLTKDPDSGAAVRRVLHPPAVHFKGKGFYNTDYGTRKRQREAAAQGAGSSSTAASSSENGKPADGPASSESKGSASDAKPTTGEGTAKKASKREAVSTK
jgi:putative FmdB family regulatory protein